MSYQGKQDIIYLGIINSDIKPQKKASYFSILALDESPSLVN